MVKKKDDKKVKEKKEKSGEEKKAHTEINNQKILEEELEKVGSSVFIESEQTPDDFKNYPLLIIASDDPKLFIYNMMTRLETSNMLRLSATNRYMTTLLRLVDLFSWCMDIRLKRKRQMTNQRGGTLIVNEFIIEKIPACRR